MKTIKGCKRHEFNHGFVSALGLFLAHEQQGEYMRVLRPDSWDFRINAAADHLYDLEIPKSIKPAFKKALLSFQKRAINARLERLSNEQVMAFFKEAKQLLYRFDGEVLRIKHVCAQHE